MFPHLSSLNSSAPARMPAPIGRRASRLTICNSMNGSSFSDNTVTFDYHANTRDSLTSLPISIRLVQLKKKRTKLPLPLTPPPSLCPLTSAVLSLASVIAEMQSVIFRNHSSYSPNSSPGEAGYCLIWLFRKVFVSSPELTVGILALMGEFLRVSAQSEIKKLVEDLQAEETRLENWISKSESGIERGFDMDESERQSVVAYYEKMILAGEVSSLILANYAQFLYQSGMDFDRADEYFSKAVTAEQADAEAMSRYAFFLWHHRGDLQNAEEMFTKAIDAEPDNSHHLSNYANFLWKTCGSDICLV